jgi:hypothetical protein
MKKTLITLVIGLLLTGCAQENKDKVALRIGEIKITAEEFEQAFKRSRPSQRGAEARADFLDNYISKKLILKEAEELGLDKEPEFLQDIQIFWEQSLMKRILSRKSKEISPTIRVTEQEIQEYYRKYKNSSYANMDIQQVYDQIHWILLKQKQSQAIKDWIESLEQDVKIQKDEQLLGTDK